MLLTLIGLLLTIMSTIIAFIDIENVLRNKRIENFQLINNLMANNYHKVANYVVKEICGNSNNSMILIPEWEQVSPKKLLTLSNVILHWDVECKKISKNRLMYKWLEFKLPYRNRKYEENMSLIFGSKFNNLPIYVLKGMDLSSDKVDIFVGKDEYFSFINKNLLLGYNSACKCSRKKKIKIDPFDYCSRASTIGLVTLIIVKNVNIDEKKTKDFFVLHKRSDNVAECKNLYSAIPGGTVQPAFFSSNNDVPESLEKTFLREFGEEILGIQEFAELSSIEELDQSLFKTNIEENLHFLGMAINPVNLYLELMTSITIDAENKPKDALFEIKENEESVGTLIWEEFTKEKVSYYSHSQIATPALNQIMKIILSDYDSITEQLLNDSVSISTESV